MQRRPSSDSASASARQPPQGTSCPSLPFSFHSHPTTSRRQTFFFRCARTHLPPPAPVLAPLSARSRPTRSLVPSSPRQSSQQPATLRSTSCHHRLASQQISLTHPAPYSKAHRNTTTPTSNQLRRQSLISTSPKHREHRIHSRRLGRSTKPPQQLRHREEAAGDRLHSSHSFPQQPHHHFALHRTTIRDDRESQSPPQYCNTFNYSLTASQTATFRRILDEHELDHVAQPASYSGKKENTQNAAGVSCGCILLRSQTSLSRAL